MSFMVKKKKFRFHVDFEIEDLSSVPFVSGVLFCKLRQIDGGSFTQYSTREEVKNHVVRWKARYTFQSKMAASANTGMLESCQCRVSVRKELKGGKSYQKLGYVDINLAEYAGCGATSNRYLLEGYDIRRRQDNSILKINLNITLLQGDPLFKVPDSKRGLVATEQLQMENKGAGAGEEDTSGASVASNGSSGFGSLPRKDADQNDDKSSTSGSQSQGLVPFSSGSHLESTHAHNKHLNNVTSGSGHVVAASGSDSAQGPRGLSHMRTESNLSTQSKGSAGYSSGHSRTSSVVGEKQAPYARTSSAGSLDSPATRLHTYLRPQLETLSSIEKRVDSTRVSADDLVNQLIANTNWEDEESAELSGLQLYVGRDGTTLLGGRHSTGEMAAGNFQRVVIDKR